MLLLFLKSFVSECVIESVTGDINSRLDISLINGRKVLNAADSNYSYGSLHRVFQQVFKKIQIKKYNLQEVLILGFGAGSILSILQHEHHLRFKTTGVEIDRNVIDLAKKHFLIHRFKNLNLLHEDAGLFIAHNKSMFDLIIIDLYINNRVPAQFETKEFLVQIKKSLQINGLVLFNKFIFNSETEKEASELVRNFEKYLGETHVIDIKQRLVNRVLLFENRIT